MRVELKATVKSYVFKVYYSTSTVEIFFRGNANTNKQTNKHILNERLDCPSIRQFIGEIV